MTGFEENNVATAAPTVNPTKGSNPFDKTILLSVTIRMLGVSKKVSTDRVDVDADKDLLRVSKKIIDCEEYRAVQFKSSTIKAFLRSKSVPGVRFIKGGIFPIPLHRVDDIDMQLNELVAEYKAAVAKFCEVYETRAAESKARLNVLGSDADYPPVEVVRKAFGVSTEYVTLGPPTALAGISKEIWDRESNKIKDQCQEAAEQVRDAMRSMFQDLVSHMIERLTPGENGKAKVFKSSLVGNFKEFIDNFADRNITDDADLAKLVGEAQAILAGKTADQLRKDETLKSSVVDQMKVMKISLDAMLADKPTRAVLIED